jgi:hypothetical protein
MSWVVAPLWKRRLELGRQPLPHGADERDRWHPCHRRSLPERGKVEARRVDRLDRGRQRLRNQAEAGFDPRQRRLDAQHRRQARPIGEDLPHLRCREERADEL